MLQFKVDGIPAGLGHFVVDKFNADNMEIDLGANKLKIDNDTIHQLLGIPNSGIQLSSTECTQKFVGIQKTWKKRYPEPYVTPTEITAKIEDNRDDGGMMFKLDFLAMFLSAMGEIQQMGKCKLEFIHHIRDDTNICDIDWCSFIVDSMKKCKSGWRRCYLKSIFTGPLTILVLTYVDRVASPGFNVERSMSPIKFWSMANLKKKERLEKKHGGFGQGEIRDMYLGVDGDKSEGETETNTFANLYSPNDLTVRVTTITRVYI
ncbi:uncharacterized protein LOC143630545 isoform X2 [Bidens hawaiensis]